MSLSLLRSHEQYFKVLPEAEPRFVSLAAGMHHYYIPRDAYVIDDRTFSKVPGEIPLLFTSLQSPWELNRQQNYGSWMIFTEICPIYLWSTVLFRKESVLVQNPLPLLLPFCGLFPISHCLPSLE